MGQGGRIVLFNATPYVWKRVSEPTAYQMEHWKDDYSQTDPNKRTPFLETLQPGQCHATYIEFESGVTINWWDDIGDVTYDMEDPFHHTLVNYQFSIRARASYESKLYRIEVKLLSFGTKDKPAGTIENLGFNHDGDVRYMIAGPKPYCMITGDPYKDIFKAGWMNEYLEILGDTTLRNLCLLGSHDSGMSKLVQKSSAAKDSNTKTQTLTVGQQLDAGVRFLGVRPVLCGTPSIYYCGHFSDIAYDIGWQGACGQTIDEVISDINNFTAHKRELIIIQLSHAYKPITVDGKTVYTDFGTSEWSTLIDKLKGINHLYHTSKAAAVGMLNDIKLNDLIGPGNENQAAVIIQLGPNIAFDLKSSHSKGFYYHTDFPFKDEYTNSMDVDEVATNQLELLEKYTKSGDNFLLAWTLTPNVWASVKQFLEISSVVESAKSANEFLWDRIRPKLSKFCRPNVISIDAIPSDDKQFANLSIYCSFIGSLK